MIDEKRSLQQVVFGLMETGKSRYLTRLWSTTPEDICILKKKDCPVHPALIHEGETSTVTAVVKHVKTHSESFTIVAAASEEERQAASSELYSQSIIENPELSEVILYLNTLDALNPIDEQRERVRRVKCICKSSA